MLSFDKELNWHQYNAIMQVEPLAHIVVVVAFFSLRKTVKGKIIIHILQIPTIKTMQIQATLLCLHI